MTEIYTIGHSTRSITELTELLQEYSIDLLVDVRRFPGSKRHPQFNRGNLEDSLPGADIDYRHEERLGGRRGNPSKESPNGGWDSKGFQAYADHLLSAEAREALDELIAKAEAKQTAVMCAEAVPWRCHRQVIADHLVARGHTVIHILGPGQSAPHGLRPMAEVRKNGSVIYPSLGEQENLFGE